MLNGRPYICVTRPEGYWPDTLMTAPSDEALRRDVELAKSMGSTVYVNTKIEDPRFLYWADVDLMVWEKCQRLSLLPSGGTHYLKWTGD